MSRKERIKTILDFYKSILMTLIVGLFGLISYAFTKSAELNAIKFFIVILGAIGFAFALYFLYKAICYKLDELEREE